MGKNRFTATIFSLLAFGLIVIYEATAYSSQKTFGVPYKYLLFHTLWTLAGVSAYLIFSRIHYTKLKIISYYMFYFLTLILIYLAISGVFFCGKGGSDLIFAPCLNGASRWFYLNPAPLPEIPLLGRLGFQPAEMLKLVLILFLSFKYADMKKRRNNDSFFVTGAITLVLCVLLLLQPNMSSMVMVFCLAMILYYLSGNSLKPLFITIPIILVVGVFMILASDYRRERLKTLFTDDHKDDLSSGYHSKQIMIALGSGGMFGVGVGQSRQKFNYLPEVASDSIFAIVGEEFGFFGTTLLLLTFGYLFYQGFVISSIVSDSTAKSIVVGVTCWLCIQLFINVSAMTKIIPLTGVPMPLISYGGSSMIFSMIGLGIVNNIKLTTEKL